jgi:PD-(D/E)XK endonuclease
MSDQKLSDELTHAAKLDRKHRGELAELAFMRKAANLGFAVAKPWGDSDRYDVVVRFEKTFWRVQVKSVLAERSSRAHFVVHTENTAGKTYSRDDVDFLVAYIFAKDLWYVFPAHIFEQKKSLCVKPGSKKSRLEEYRENWDLMRSSGVLPVPAPTAPTTLPSHGDAAVSPPPAPRT